METYIKKSRLTAQTFRKIIVYLSLTFFIPFITTNLAFATGSIVGTVSMVVEKIQLPLSNASVQFFDAMNAEIVATATTSGDGTFNSGPLPQGSYKIRFEYSESGGTICISEYLGETGTHSDVFDTGNIISVFDGQETGITAQVSSQWDLCAPRKCVDSNVGLNGSIVDAKTLNPLSGIKVRVKGAENAMQLFELTTDNNGNFQFLSKFCQLPFPPTADVKVRLLDPSGLHIPEYVGASGMDSFELGSVLNLATIPSISEDLAQITPAQEIGQLIDQVRKMPLPETTANTLIKLANQAKNFLEDTNPNNDKSACGILKGFVNRLKGMVAKGEITQTEADALSNSVVEVQNNLGCNP